MPTISVTPDSLNMAIDVLYTADEYTITITYTNSVVGYVFDTVTKTVLYGSVYSIDSPDMPGSSPNYSTIEGTMGAGNLNFNVVYYIDKHNVSVNYLYEDGTEVSPSYVAQVAYGTTFNVTSPQVANYTANLSSVSGTMGVSDLSFNVVYTPKTCLVTIFYLYSDGTVAADSKTIEVICGKDYSVTSPAIAGYVADKSKVSGTVGSSDLSYNVTYLESVHSGEGSDSEDKAGMSTIETVSISAVGVIAVASLACCIFLFRRH